MEEEDERLFSGHSAGFCGIAINPTETSMLTCGSDGTTIEHKFPIGDELEQLCEYDPEESVTCIKYNPTGKKFATGHTDNTVRIWTVGRKSGPEVVTRFTTQVQDVVWSPDGKKIACCSSDSGIKIVEINNTSEVKLLRGHDGGVKRLSWDPRGDMLASTGFDGHARIWNIQSGTSEIVANYKAPHKGDEHYCGLDWSPDGRFLAISGLQQEIAIVKRAFPVVAFLLKDNQAASSSPTIHTSFAPGNKSGRWVCSVNSEGDITVYDLSSKSAVFRKSLSALVTGVSWAPSRNALTMILVSADVLFLTDPVPVELWGVAGSFGTAEKRKATEDGDRRKKETKFQPKVFIGDQAQEVSDGDSEGNEYEAPLDHEEGPAEGTEDYDEFASPSHAPHVSTFVDQPPLISLKLQEPFQSGATPLVNGRRYLAYNMVGVIIASDDGLQSSVEIDFHDISLHKKVRITDLYSLDKAALAEHGAVFASSHSDETGKSMLLFRNLKDKLISRADWQFVIDNTGRDTPESFTAVAVGGNFVVAATSLNQLRLFSITGMQTGIIGVPGTVLTMAGFESHLFVVYRTSTLTNALAFRFLDITSRTLLCEGALPLAPNTSLVWADFSDEGKLVMCDSAGLVQMLSLEFGGSFVPVCHASVLLKSTTERVWPIAVAQSRFIFAIRRSEDEWPSPGRRPLQHTAPLAIPTLGEDETGIEQNRIFLTMALHGEEDEEEALRLRTEHDKETLKAVQVACKADRGERALELCETLFLPKSVEIAQSIASRLNLLVLEEKITELYEAKFLAEEEEEMEEEMEFEEAPASYRRRDVEPGRPVSIADDGSMFGDEAEAEEGGEDVELETEEGSEIESVVETPTERAARQAANRRRDLAVTPANTLVVGSKSVQNRSQQRPVNPFASSTQLVSAAPSDKNPSTVFEDIQRLERQRKSGKAVGGKAAGGKPAKTAAAKGKGKGKMAGKAKTKGSAQAKLSFAK